MEASNLFNISLQVCGCVGALFYEENVRGGGGVNVQYTINNALKLLLFKTELGCKYKECTLTDSYSILTRGCYR